MEMLRAIYNTVKYNNFFKNFFPVTVFGVGVIFFSMVFRLFFRFFSLDSFILKWVVISIEVKFTSMKNLF